MDDIKKEDISWFDCNWFLIDKSHYSYLNIKYNNKEKKSREYIVSNFERTK